MALKPRDRMLGLENCSVQVVRWSKNENISVLPMGDTTCLQNVRDDIPVEPCFFVSMAIGPLADGGELYFLRNTCYVLLG